MDNRPIGIFDSGMGGLYVHHQIRTMLRNESLVFYGDGLNCPYGDKSDEDIRRFTDDAVGYLVGRGAKLVVLACNTATAAAVSYIRDKYDIPIVGMEPAVKPAALSTSTGTVAILATEASLRGELYINTASQYGAGIELLPTVGRGFVELVENDLEDTEEAYWTVSAVVEPLIEAGADRIVLGCTHYGFLKNTIEKVIGGRNVQIVDSAPAVERRVEQLLDENSLRADASNVPFYEFYSPFGEAYIERLRNKSLSM